MKNIIRLVPASFLIGIMEVLITEPDNVSAAFKCIYVLGHRVIVVELDPLLIFAPLIFIT